LHEFRDWQNRALERRDVAALYVLSHRVYSRIVIRHQCSVTIAIASVTLVACDGPWELEHDRPTVRNVSDLEETVSVRTYNGAFACDAVHSGSGAISRAGLSELRIVTLSNGETVGLRPDAGSAPLSNCGAAVVSSARLLAPLLITWDFLAGVDAGSSVEGVDRGQVYWEQFGAELRPSPGRGMVVTEWNALVALP
jgi:hypothetical protein